MRRTPGKQGMTVAHQGRGTELVSKSAFESMQICIPGLHTLTTGIEHRSVQPPKPVCLQNYLCIQFYSLNRPRDSVY